MREDNVQSYEKIGLLQPARRQLGGGVAYHQEHIDRLRFIGRALECGFSLEATAELVRTDRLMTCSDVYQIAYQQLERLQCEEPESPAGAKLKKLIAGCLRTGGRGDCSIYAALAVSE
jgi:DNA-binding transcriptional MerR regulator